MNHNTEDVQVSQHGGTLRVQHGGAVPDAPSTPPETARVNTGPLRYDGREVSPMGVARYTVGSEPAPTHSIMATRQRAHGHDTVELVPGQAASRTDIRTAVREGLLRETYPGHYEDTAPQQAQQQQVRPQAPQEPAGDSLNAELRGEVAIWNEAIEPLPQHSYEGAVAKTIVAVSSGSDDLSHVARALAESAGLEPDYAQELVDTGVEWYKSVLTRDLVKQGLCTEASAEDFYASVVGNPKLQRAMQELATEGRTETFRQLAREWRIGESSQQQDSLQASFTRNGFDTTVDRDTGELLVRRGSGRWVPLSRL